MIFLPTYNLLWHHSFLILGGGSSDLPTLGVGTQLKSGRISVLHAQGHTDCSEMSQAKSIREFLRDFTGTISKVVFIFARIIICEEDLSQEKCWKLSLPANEVSLHEREADIEGNKGRLQRDRNKAVMTMFEFLDSFWTITPSYLKLQ